jgi:hypothetical protein
MDKTLRLSEPDARLGAPAPKLAGQKETAA